MNRALPALAALAAVLLVPVLAADASHNPNLHVSAEDPRFENHFAGPMVVEVVVSGRDVGDVGEAEGEPDVTINGGQLRMAQGSDGRWYAYIAHVDAARAADATVGLPGTGLDFGVFCSRDTPASVFGVSFSDTDGFAVPGPGGLDAYSDGGDPLVPCSGSASGGNDNNVVRKARPLNSNAGVPAGQIGLDRDAWPLIQLFSFDDVEIQYNRAGSAQRVVLYHDEIPGVSFETDRGSYPRGAEVFLTMYDAQLNQDPTDRDSWTFGTGSPPRLFYRAFDDSGSPSAHGGAGLVDLHPSLGRLGFDDNGVLEVEPGGVLHLGTNREQPVDSVSDGEDRFGGILTLVETRPDSGIFDSGDHADRSVLGVLDDAPRGQAGVITYNGRSSSVLTGSSTASVSVESPSLKIGTGPGPLVPGREYDVVLYDPDQNTNSGVRDRLLSSRAEAAVPSLRIGDPVTLEHASGARYYSDSGSSPDGGTPARSSVPDPASARLYLEPPSGPVERMSVNLGIDARTLRGSLADPSGGWGASWLNYDFRSLERDLGISDFADASVSLSFGSRGAEPVVVAGPGEIASPKGLVRIDDGAVRRIGEASGTAYLALDLDSSRDSRPEGRAPAGGGDLPVIADFVSFGVSGTRDVGNSIYRFELVETSANSSTFAGTLEYFVGLHAGLPSPEFLGGIRPIDDDVRFVILGRPAGGDDIVINYSDLDRTGVPVTVSFQSGVRTTTGSVSVDSASYRFGQPVTITVDDPDLNRDDDTIEIYLVDNNPASAGVDTVGDGGSVLLEVLIKGVRYQRCVVNGSAHGGLGATGFTLAETGPDTGRFEGTFKMPSQICNKSGTALMSPAGGGVDVRYHDARDASGNPAITDLGDGGPVRPSRADPRLSADAVALPGPGGTAEVVLSGDLAGHRRGVMLDVTLTGPDGRSQEFASAVTGTGAYRSVIMVDQHTPAGRYHIGLSYAGADVGSASFDVVAPRPPAVPEPAPEPPAAPEPPKAAPEPPGALREASPQLPPWLRNTAGWWAEGMISDPEFIDGLEYLIAEGLVRPPPASSGQGAGGEVPGWLRSSAGWWADGSVTDDEFLESVRYLVQKGLIRM